MTQVHTRINLNFQRNFQLYIQKKVIDFFHYTYTFKFCYCAMEYGEILTFHWYLVNTLLIRNSDLIFYFSREGAYFDP